MDSIKITSDLISCKSITPDNDGAIEKIEKILKESGFTCKILEFGRGSLKVKNLYAYLKRGKGPNICFAGHTDVVPAGNIEQWKTNPFISTVKNGRLFGRGASDMKGAIGAYLEASLNLIKYKKKFNGTISLLITGDEEGDANYGTKKVVDWLDGKKIRLDYCIVGEPTNPKFLGEMAKIGRRGSLNGVLNIHGKQGHVAYPERALNPIPSLLEYCSKLKEPLDKGNDFFQASNLEITSIDVDNQVTNLIPSEAFVRFNVRFNNNFTSKTLVSLLKKRLNMVGKNYDLDVNVSGESFYNSSEKLSKSLTSAIYKTLRLKPKMSTSGGTSDARFISNICPVIEFGLVGNTMHQVNENVKVSDIKKLSKIYFEFLKKIFF